MRRFKINNDNKFAGHDDGLSDELFKVEGTELVKCMHKLIFIIG